MCDGANGGAGASHPRPGQFGHPTGVFESVQERGTHMTKAKWLMSALIVVLAFGLLLAACGGGDETTTTAPPATTPTTAPATTAPPTTAPPTSDTTPTTLGAPTETLRIGCILSLTDWYSVVDAADVVDLQYIADKINNEGGIRVQGKGYKVELVVEDAKSTLDGNTTAATKLVLDEKVQFVIGPGAFFNVATSTILEQAKVLHVACYNGLQPGEMGPDTPYEFLGMDPINQQSAALKALKEYYPNVKTVCMASEDATFAPFEKPLKDLLSRSGLTLSGEPVLFATNSEDYNPLATKIKAQNPDAVWMPIGIVPSFAGIAKGLRTLGYTGPIVVPVDAPQFLGIAGAEASTDIVTILSKSPDDPNQPALLKELWGMGDPKRNIYGLAPNALIMIKYAIEQADSLDPTVVRDKWETFTTIPTLFGDGFPTGNQLYGLKNHAWAYPVPVALLMNGQIEVKPWIVPDPTP
jgi:branched-chain amino acid transport system substrate-binding protein